MKKSILMLLASILVVGTFVGCGKSTSTSEENIEKEKVNQAETDNSQSTANPENTKVGDPQKKAILVVSFGTSYNDTRAVTIDAIEKAITDEFSDEYDVKRAFTSQFIIDKLADRDGLEINNVEQAMEELIDEGYGTLVVQPTHVMHGEEYDELMEAVNANLAYFDTVKVGEPLLSATSDYEEVSKVLVEATEDYQADDTVIAFMGHGTTHFANATYACLDYHLKDVAGDHYFVGTVEGYPTLDNVISGIEKLGGIKKVVLLPCMIVAGDHANNDMAGDEEGSWKTILKSQGYEVEAVLKGLGEYPEIQQMYVQRVHEAIESTEED